MQKRTILMLLTILLLCGCASQGTTKTYLHMSAPTATFAPLATQVPVNFSSTAATASIFLSSGSCADIETASIASGPECDLLYADGEMVPQNGAVLSSVEHIVEPPATQCIQEQGEMNAGGRRLLADRYYCFRTNAGTYGFLRATPGSDMAGAAGITIERILER